MFISYEFILFLLVLFTVYYVIPKRFQWILLLIANFLFYYSAGAFYPLFILATSVTVWFAGVCIDLQERQWQSYQAEMKDRETVQRREEGGQGKDLWQEKTHHACMSAL